MKKVFLGLLLIPTLLLAGNYNIVTTTAQDNRLEKQRVRLNASSCSAVQLPNDCTQGQCRGKDPNCNIYSSIADLIDRNIVKNYTDSLKNVDTRDDQALFCAYWATATLIQKNKICVDAALPNGCELCL